MFRPFDKFKARHDQGALRHERPAYYGWVLAWLLGPTQLVTWGVVYYTFSIMLAPMQREMGWSSAEVTGAFSLALLVSGASAVVVGRALDARGPRQLMIGGVCISVALVVAWSQVRSLPALYAAWLGLGALMPAVLYDPALWVVTRWFSGEHAHERGRALTVLTFFGGLASTAFIPLSAALSEALGWRQALLALAGVLAAVTFVPYGLLLKGTPPAPPQPNVEPMLATARLKGRGLLRNDSFWLLAIPLALTGMAWSAMSVHFVTFAASRGQDIAFVALAAALVGVMQVVGRLIFVPLGDRVSPKLLAVALCVCQSAAIAALLTLPPAVGLIVYAICFGVGHGAMTPMRATLTADTFGIAHFGSVAGAISLVVTLARAIAPVAVGLAVAAWGGYTAVLLAVLAASLVAAGVLFRL